MISSIFTVGSAKAVHALVEEGVQSGMVYMLYPHHNIA